MSDYRRHPTRRTAPEHTWFYAQCPECEQLLPVSDGRFPSHQLWSAEEKRDLKIDSSTGCPNTGGMHRG
jgi:hypothetical protein